jgi:hypothetical protein
VGKIGGSPLNKGPALSTIAIKLARTGEKEKDLKFFEQSLAVANTNEDSSITLSVLNTRGPAHRIVRQTQRYPIRTSGRRKAAQVPYFGSK